MSTTLMSRHSLDQASEPARPVAASSAPLRVLMVLTATLAMLLVGAGVLQLAGSDLTLRTAPVFARLVAGAVALVLVVALPLWWERNARRRWRQTDALLRRPRVSWVLPWSVALLLAPALLAPDLTRAALTTHGAWAVRGGPGALVRAVERGTRAVAAGVPRQTPLTVTHRTGWPWVDRNSPECRSAPAASR